jgi:uncharacterized membrane protein YbhN (UPF0104 family)
MVGLLVWVIVRDRVAIADSLSQLTWPVVLSSFVSVVIALVTGLLSWRSVLRGLGSPLGLVPASRVFFLAQLGKYAPGSIWPLLAQMELGRDHGVPRSRSGIAGLVSLIIGVIVGSTVGLAFLALSGSPAFLQYRWLAVVPLVGVVTLVPPVLQRVIDLGLRLARRDSEQHRMRTGDLVSSVLWSVLTWLLLGLQCYLLARDLGAGGDRLVLLSAGAFATSWVVGFLVVFAPAGAGVREAALVIILTPVLARADALSLALVSRVLMSVGDLAVAAFALAGMRLAGHSRLEVGEVSSGVGPDRPPTLPPDVPGRSDPG